MSMKPAWAIWLVLLLGAMIKAEDLKIDELGGGTVFEACTNANKVAFTLTDIPSTHLYIFDFKSERFTKVVDGRYKIRMVDICSSTEGFVLFNRPVSAPGSALKLNGDGALVESLPFSDIQGMNEGYFFLNFSNYKNTILVSFEDGRDWRKAYLGILDLDKRTLKKVAELKNQEDHLSTVWLPAGNELYLVSPFSGQVRQASGNFQPTKTLIRGQDLVASSTKLPKGYSGNLFLSYRPRITMFIQLEGQHSFIQIQPTTEKETVVRMGHEFTVDKVIKTPFTLSGGKTEPFPDQIIGQYQTKALVFHLQTETFSIHR